MNDMLKTYPLTLEQLNELLDDFADAYGTAVLAAGSNKRDYDEATLKAVEAREAIRQAVFP